MENFIEKLMKSADGNESKAGELFEEFVKQFLKTHNYWGKVFEEVWLWAEYPNRKDRQDIGVDLVAKDKEGNLWAIQCKFYQKSTIKKEGVSSFIAASPPDEFKYRMFVYVGTLTDNTEEIVRMNKVYLLNLMEEDVDLSKINWAEPDKFDFKRKKEMREYQKEAINKAIKYYETGDRGKIIMPPGAGKTFVSLKIAEKIAGEGGYVLFVVPSIALADQTLRAWMNDAEIQLNPFIVSSDKTIGKKDNAEEYVENSILTIIPPTTDAKTLADNIKNSKGTEEKMTVIISTYQSLDVIKQAQKEYDLPEFDIIIADEAHYTTGILEKDKKTVFKLVHFNDDIKGKKRLYMTATPKVFNIKEGVINQKKFVKKSFEEENNNTDGDFEVYSMDEKSIYGDEIYTYTFAQAIKDGYLTDYKVVIFLVSEENVHDVLSNYLRKGHSQFKDAAKMLGIVKVLEGSLDDHEKISADIKRAVIFCSNIKRSKEVAKKLPIVAEEMQSDIKIACKHIDGTMRGEDKKDRIDWLKEGPKEEDVRVLSNSKVLTEGVDVPSLDSVIFLDPKNSVVDIIQAVGRVVRKSEGKTYGYIVVPIVLSKEKYQEAITEGNLENIEGMKSIFNDEEDYKLIFRLLSALRSLDTPFIAQLSNDLRYYIEQPDKEDMFSLPKETKDNHKVIFGGFGIDKEVAKQVYKDISTKIINKIGGKKYLDDWAKDVAKKSGIIFDYINNAIEKEENLRNDFNKFLDALRSVLNPGISEDDAKLFIVQHLITKPIFDALFEKYSLLKDNLVSSTLDDVVSHFSKFIEKELEDMKSFYEEVKIQLKNIKDEKSRQDYLRRLYDNFFAKAFPKVADKLGIVYTPVELVDFIIKSVDDILKEDFQTSLSNENVIVLEPFAGTGTFLTRLMSFLDEESLKRKYNNGEIWGNEILLLPYYVALANIQSTYYSKTNEYKPFKYLLLTDTFQLEEKRNKKEQLTFGFFPQEYLELMKTQNKSRINVIISNPPWRARQEDMTEGNASAKYEYLDNRIRETYVSMSIANNKNSLYDSYVRAIRYASDRIGEQGVIGFVLNNGFLESKSFDGFRKCIAEEFKKVYILNLRGNIRTQGEVQKKEGENIFGQGSRVGVCILLLVKGKKKKGEVAEIYYYQVEDGLKREQKLSFVRDAEIKNISWQKITPNNKGQWINQGIEDFEDFVSVRDIFNELTLGIASNRDVWVYDFSKEKLKDKMEKFIKEYNEQLKLVKEGKITKKEELTTDKTKISWSESLINAIFRKDAKEVSFSSDDIVKVIYRPFITMNLYYNDLFIHRRGKFPIIFPTKTSENKLISFASPASGLFSPLMVNKMVDVNTISPTYAIPLYIYNNEKNKNNKTLFSDKNTKEGDNQKQINIKEEFYNKLKESLGTDINPEDIFYYVYAVLSHPVYAEKYANNLKHELPRIPMPKDLEIFNRLVDIGKKLSDIHINYENAQEYPLEVVINGNIDNIETYFPKVSLVKNNPEVIKYNDYIIIKGIPKEIYEWKIGDKSPLKWFESYLKPRTDKDSGITIDPADYIKETGDKEYYIKLIKKVVNVGLETLNLLKELKEIKIF